MTTAGLTPEELAWKAYLGGNGHGTHITDDNLSHYIDEESQSKVFGHMGTLLFMSPKHDACRDESKIKLLGARAEVLPAIVDEATVPTPITAGLPSAVGTSVFESHQSIIY